jgi:hypothetical protein
MLFVHLTNRQFLVDLVDLVDHVGLYRQSVPADLVGLVRPEDLWVP